MHKTALRHKIILIGFGIFLTAVLLEIALRTAGFIYLSTQEYRNRKNLLKTGTIRILCLGESTTAMQYPRALEEILNKKSNHFKFKVIDKGVPGTNSSLILRNLKENIDIYQPQIIVVMMGINDYSLTDTESIGIGKMPQLFYFAGNLRVSKLIYAIGQGFGIKAKIFLDFVSRAISGRFEFCAKGKKKRIAADIQTLLKAQAIMKRGEEYIIQRKFKEAELMFKKALQLRPDDDWAYARLGLCYRWTNRIRQSWEAYSYSLVLNPANWLAYVGQGELCDLEGKDPVDAERFFIKAAELESNEWTLLALAYHYLYYLDFDKARNACLKVLSLTPLNAPAIEGLGHIYLCSNVVHNDELSVYIDRNKAIDYFKKSIEIDPNRPSVFLALGFAYFLNKEYIKAESSLLQAIKIEPKNPIALQRLGEVYLEEGRYSEAAQVFLDAKYLVPEKEINYAYLVTCYNNLGDKDRADEYSLKLETLQSGYINKFTKKNYRMLADEARKGNAIIFCMQYPLRKSLPLRTMLQGYEVARFVDNERIFKDALRAARYEDYFTDRFAGDFGHCTEKGNRLLAENLAGAISREYDNAL